MIIEISVPDSFCIYTIEISVLFLIAAGEEKQSNFTDCKNSWQARRMRGRMWDMGFRIADLERHSMGHRENAS
jgi:hypothetical protein